MNMRQTDYKRTDRSAGGAKAEFFKAKSDENKQKRADFSRFFFFDTSQQ